MQQAEDTARGEFEAGDVEDLRTDVAVQTDHPQVFGFEDPADGGQRRAAGHGQSEFLVLVCGRDELMGVRFDADGETDEDVLDDACLARNGIQTLDLGHRVQNDVADTGFDRRGQFRDRLVVAVEGDPLRREVGVQRNGQLAAGAHVERQAFLVDPARDLAAQKGFRGIVHVLAPTERRRDLAATGAEIVLVDDEQRRAVLLGEVGHRNPRDAGDSAFIASRVAGPHVWRQQQQLLGGLRPRRAVGMAGLFGVPGTGGMNVHIRSGAVTPSIAKPLAITWRVAWHSARRAVCRSVGCSSPCGSTRQES